MSESKYRVGERFRESAKHLQPLIIEILEVETSGFLCTYISEDGSRYGYNFRLPLTIFQMYLTHIPKRKHIKHYFGETWDNK